MTEIEETRSKIREMLLAPEPGLATWWMMFEKLMAENEENARSEALEEAVVAVQALILNLEAGPAETARHMALVSALDAIRALSRKPFWDSVKELADMRDNIPEERRALSAVSSTRGRK